jgi:uncharacterized protein
VQAGFFTKASLWKCFPLSEAASIAPPSSSPIQFWSYALPITAFYASLLAPLFLVLAIRVVALRKSARVALGDGGERTLLRRIRAHANFAEYVPYTLILMGLAESLSASVWLLHGAGAALLAGRFLHAYSVSRHREVIRHRVVAMLATFGALAIMAATCFVLSARRAFIG